ncbi:MAG: SH3 domain-containing protein [Rhodospirillales bacterium]
MTRSAFLTAAVMAVKAAALWLAFVPAGAWAQTSASGLPVPRYVSLRADEVNMRTGPGVQYPVEWVYKRVGLPVEVIAEFETWRKIRDWEGAQGWVHQSMLSGRRTFIVTSQQRTVRREPSAAAAAAAVAEPGVIGAFKECEPIKDWCEVEVGGHSGWLRRADVWGVYRGEPVE